MLDLPLARDTPILTQEHEPKDVSTINISNFDNTEKPTTAMTETVTATKIINPYSRASKERIERIKQAILKSKSTTIQEIVDMTADPDENIYARGPPDTMDDSATQSTTATTETYRQHGTNKSVNSKKRQYSGQ